MRGEGEGSYPVRGPANRQERISKHGSIEPVLRRIAPSRCERVPPRSRRVPFAALSRRQNMKEIGGNFLSGKSETYRLRSP